ncbi:hypothetical protein GOBAR_AA01478 [Gossypium barbadense]|uniref:Uncharacterized protein n=1 Tax=Gossypium barbadense TaxID=3634 RepID=A0A2P5YU28_GOSBA|nr:hypothetical protein GOBAR_AA01478 [Gossypium barbadense]
MEPNLREHLNAISAQDKEGFIAPEPELQQVNMMNKGREEDNAIKPVDDKTNIQSSLQEPSQTKTTETVRYYHEKNKDVHEERRLRIGGLEKWREHKPRTHDKLKLRQNKPDTTPNQLKVGDKVLLDAVDPHIVTTTPNEEIPLTVLSIFPFGTVEVSHPKFGTFKHTRLGTWACLKPWPNRGRDTTVRDSRVKAGHDFPKIGSAINPHDRILCRHQGARRPRSHPPRDVGDRVLHRYELQPKFGTHSLNFHKLRGWSYLKYYVYDPSPQVVMTKNDDPGTIHFRLDCLVHVMSVPEFGVALELYTNEFTEEEDMNALPRNTHISPSLCWKALAPLSSTYDPSARRPQLSPLPFASSMPYWLTH